MEKWSRSKAVASHVAHPCENSGSGAVPNHLRLALVPHNRSGFLRLVDRATPLLLTHGVWYTLHPGLVELASRPVHLTTTYYHYYSPLSHRYKVFNFERAEP